MSGYRIRFVLAASLLLAAVVATGTHFGMWGHQPVAEGASYTPAQDRAPLEGERLESLPSMHIWNLSVGCWHGRGNSRYAVAGVAVEDEYGNPVADALVEVEFDIECLRKGADGGSAYTVLDETEQYAVAYVTGSETFRPKKGTCCTITAEVVSVTHPDYTWDPNGGVPTVKSGGCCEYF